MGDIFCELPQMLSSLLTGDLLLADRYYCTFAIIALLQAKGVPVLFPLHANKKADFRLGSKLGAKDHLIEWKKPKRKPVWMTTQDYADLPEIISVREFRVKGVVYVTTLLNAKQFHKQELANLYKEHWKMESGFKELKQDIGSRTRQCLNAQGVNNPLQFCMMVSTITWLYADRLKADPERRHKVKGLTSFAYSDVRRLIAEAALNVDFDKVCPKPGKPTKNSLVAVLLRMVA